MKLRNGLKVNVTQIIAYLIIIGITVASSWFLFSCSDARLVQHHLKKAEQHGGKIVCDTTYIDVPKIVKGKDGKDSLIYVPTAVPCKPCQLCETKMETKWRYKYDLKRQKERDKFLIDSLNQVNKLAKTNGKDHKQTLKAETKQQKQIQKTERKDSFPWRLLLIVIGLLTLILLTFKWLPK